MVIAFGGYATAQDMKDIDNRQTQQVPDLQAMQIVAHTLTQRYVSTLANLAAELGSEKEAVAFFYAALQTGNMVPINQDRAIESVKRALKNTSTPK